MVRHFFSEVIVRIQTYKDKLIVGEKKSKRPTISDVAQKAGVSIATVSRVLNQNNPVTDETIQKVKQAIKELHYRPFMAARNLARNTTHMIGLILPQISGDYFPAILKGVEAALKETGYRLLVVSTQNDQESSYNEILPLSNHITDGLLVFANAVDDEALRQYHDEQFPIVLLFQRPPEGLKIPEVGVENESGAYEIVEHLIKVHGRRRIVFIKGPENNEDSKLREKGYRKALTSNNITLVSELLVRGDYNMDTAYESVFNIIEDGVKFDAVVGADDESAIGAIQALKSKGIQVPKEVSVVGFDDINLAAYIQPSLTTVSVPLETVGTVAANQVLNSIEGKEIKQMALLPTKPVFRNSCGCK